MRNSWSTSTTTRSSKDHDRRTIIDRRGFIAGAALATLAIAGCSSSKKDAGSGTASIAPDTSAELVLAYWDKNQTRTVKENIKSFNKKYPNVKVTTNLAGYEDYWKKLRTQAQGNELPDVFWMNGPNIQLYAGNGMLAPIDKVTDAGVKWSDYPEALVKLYTYDDKHYGVPKDFDTIGVFYNKKIFKDAGVELPTADWTWDDFHDKAKKISDWGKSKGIYGCATTINGDGQGTYYNTIFQAGGFVIKDDKSGFDDPKSIEGLQCWADWVKDGSVASPKVITDTKPSQMFKSGKSAMYWSGDWTASELAEEFKGHENDYDVVVLPKKDRKATVIHGLGWVVSARSANQAAALAFVAHMGSKQAQETEARNGTAIPAFHGTQDPWVKAFPQWNCRMFVDAATAYAVTYPVSRNTSVWADKEADYVNPAFSGEMPVPETARKLATFMNDALAKEKG